MVFVDEAKLKDALEEYSKYKGKLSLTDTVSAEVMKKYKVIEIFSHDSDFDTVKNVRRRVSF